MNKKISKSDAMKRSMEQLMKAKRDHETAVTNVDRDEAHKRVQHWQNIASKVAAMKEHREFKTFRQFVEELQRLDEISAKSVGKYMRHATRDIHDLSMDRGQDHERGAAEDKTNTRRLNNRAKGMARAIKKVTGSSAADDN